MIDNTYSFDLALTQDCNFGCSYCIERGYFKNKYMTDDIASKLVDKINYLKHSDYGQNINDINICYWGGEPTLNSEIIYYITNRFMNNFDIRFKLFTNSLLLSQYYDIIDKTNNRFNDKEKYNDNQRFAIQISYDGLSLHNKNRIDLSGKKTGEIVRFNILEAVKRKYLVNLKSTISFNDIDKLYESYMDICNLCDECCSIRTSYKDFIVYSPTIDYSLISYKKINYDKLKELLAIFEEQLIKIAQNELLRIKNNQSQVFSWFFLNDNIRRNCSAGSQYKSINFNGDIITCHGCTFIKSYDDHIISSLNKTNEEFLNDMILSDVKFKDYNDIEPEECKKCNSLICYRCNAIKYQISRKKTYLDKWYDFNNQPKLCYFHKKASNVLRALKIKFESMNIKNT